MVVRFILAMVCLLFLASPVLSLDVHEHILENGLKVLILEDHSAPTATFQVLYRVGSRNEAFGKTGLSHLLEHMMFKGTSRFGPKTFSQTIKRAGGIDNAFTSKEYTGYFQLLASKRISLPIELEADRMNNLLLADEAVLAERNVVMEERRLRYEDDPQNYLFEEVMAMAFKNHPYRWPVIGWMSDLEQLKPADLMNHYKTYYVPNNAVILVVGDVNTEHVLAEIKEHFARIPKGPEVNQTAFSDPAQKGERRVYVRKEAELPYILSAFKVPNIKHEHSYALEVLAMILSEGKSSRLYTALIYEKQIALSAWASYSGFYRDPFLFFVGATPAQGIKSEDVEQALEKEMERIKKQAPTEREVQKAKNQIEASFIMEQDSIYMQARTIGTFEMLGGWRFIETYLHGIRNVTPEDVRSVAEHYLVDERRTTGILIPLEESTDKE